MLTKSAHLQMCYLFLLLILAIKMHIDKIDEDFYLTVVSLFEFQKSYFALTSYYSFSFTVLKTSSSSQQHLQ